MQTIGKYRVEKVLGRGGMGTVYEAVDTVLHRKVALKTMIPGLADAPDLRARFLREAQAAGGLRHRNIVTVYDLGEDQGQPYIAMEFIEGSDLEAVIQRREPRTVEWKIDVIRQVCEGLGYAHRNGIIHRDVKPANIRVTPESEVKIMDFGIAHLQSSTMTKGGLVLGTMHYMAPEQVEGRKVDHRADIFSVGAIAYELVAYRKPFDGESLTAVMFRIMHDRADPAALPKTEYSPALEQAIMKALEKEPADRYQTLEEMRDALEAVVREAAPRVLKRERVDDEAESLRMRVEREMGGIRAEMDRAHGDGQLQKALGLCRRLLDLDPDDEALTRTAASIEAEIREREVAQLAEMALSYATDGDLELAGRIVGKMEGLSPDSPRLAELRAYLSQEGARRAAEAFTATAQEHLALGNLDEALAAAEEALKALPTHPVALEIRERAGSVLARRAPRALAEEGAPEAPPAAAAPSDTADPAPDTAEPPETVALPAVRAEAPPAATPEPPAPPVAAPILPVPEEPSPVPEPPAPALPSAAQAPTPTPTPAPVTPQAVEPSRKAEAAALTAAALNHFVQNSYPKARKAAEKALALDPGNRRAQELMKILGALG